MRPAVIADIPRLIKLGIAMHSESRFAQFPVNLEKAERFFKRLIEAPAGTVIFLVDGDPVHAVFIGVVQPFWWGDVLESFDILFYVSRKKRGGPSAMRLLSAYKKIAAELGVIDPKITIGSGIQTERTSQFYKYFGFKTSGVIHTLNSKGDIQWAI